MSNFHPKPRQDLEALLKRENKARATAENQSQNILKNVIGLIYLFLCELNGSQALLVTQKNKEGRKRNGRFSFSRKVVNKRNILSLQNLSDGPSMRGWIMKAQMEVHLEEL